ncbi:flagellar hook-length control protein FliK [Undibacterium terreum]|uniref:Flagellar hook-length control protein-like C-terminal domain-containing protein n=1 Tax=Undibacterium terreum TaxID=1224302 RepID=A0A916UJZ9_9BURK|nr:flagellar hook-length control protein FliK [Undibacterium terreum]GGC74529.1 hypothetical protein GCM10011396_22210 [Undibacterium terreum]
MTITLSSAAAQAAPQEQENTPAPASTIDASASSAVASAATNATTATNDSAPKNGLLDDVWTRFSQIFASAGAAADTGATDTTAGADTALRADAPAADEKSADELKKDTDLPAMALSLMPALLNFPANAGMPAMAPTLPGMAKASAKDTTIAGLDSTTSSATSATSAAGAAQDSDAGLLNMPFPAAADAGSGSNDSNAASLTSRGNIRAMAEASLAASGSRQADAGNSAALPAANGSERSNGTGLATVGNNANANLWSSSAIGFNNANAAAADTVKLSGSPAQWQQPLREALGDRLQMQLARNSEQAVIRLDPPMLGRIEISIRHEAGALQVNMSASNNEVLRQLHGIGDSLRQDLSHRQYTDVAVTVTAAPRSNSAGTDADGRQRQAANGRDQEENIPGRALSDIEQAASGFAMLTDKE